MNEIMNNGIAAARKTMKENKGGPFGAVIVDKNNKIIAISSNLVLERHDPTAHAEILAIRKAGEVLGTHDLSGCTLYATGYPCPMCLAAAIWANIKKIYYGTTLEEAERIGFRDDFIYKYLKDKEEKVLEIENIDHDECLKLFLEYEKEQKEIY